MKNLTIKQSNLIESWELAGVDLSSCANFDECFALYMELIDSMLGDCNNCSN